MRPIIRFSPGSASWPANVTWLAVVVLAPVLLGIVEPARADLPRVQKLRHYSAPEYTRVVLDLDQPTPYEVRELANPQRLVVNVTGARLASVAPLAIGDGLIERVRRHQNDARAQVVLDLGYATRYKVFTLEKDEERPARIVIDVFRRADDDTRAEPQPPLIADAQDDLAPTLAPVPALKPPVVVEPVPTPPESLIAPPPRPLRIVLDPGHGGMDPGAIRGKVREKDVVLAVCLELKKILDAQPGVVTVLTRSRDYYPSLSRRVAIAREERGDLFLSVHCNTHPKPSVSGMEVYFLSLQGATDREAQELADKENAADLVGLAPGERQGDAVMSILMDLKMTQVLQQSSRLAESLLAETAAANLGTRRAKQARFQVLRSLAMPAALVEIAYLSHDGDRALLASPQGQRRYAEVLAAGILRFCADRELPGVEIPTVLAARTGTARTGTAKTGTARTGTAKTGPENPSARNWRQKYKVRRGDSLWELAQRHGVTMDEIARENKLRDRSLRIGQNLRLPGE